MSSTVTDNSDNAPDQDARDIHAKALRRYERGYNHDRHNVEAVFDDLAFCLPENQWDAGDRRRREATGRPILTFDKTAHRDDRLSATRYALMMRRFAEVAPAEQRRARARPRGGWMGS